ncbi:hydroxyphenylacetyl-CoA thioesterase PaaI [Aquisalimonas lutea]|uniref:hydroxyphenylacetyl-CoA thioesterase PaaI n=1 Tax=Aquisalimonas lutea TaxID=1327750 RepID=UPI0025B33F51|nr:hydroxyphenylacetyl-CoA thioesterase PaaI [Aquisalimonas lutea]MDN3518199.1 hydroxyphenylacetyl-CoA thioesterase PaaI [Aquisalimonas lutea]
MSEEKAAAEQLPPAEMARRCAEAMWRDDHASQALGMRIEDIGPRYASLSMTIRRDMLNGHASCHGGLIFALADSAFAFACNWSNRLTVASSGTIEFLAPGREGDVLTATAQERSRAGRTGVYDATVCNQAGDLVALFRGRSYTVPGELIPGVELTEN